MLPRYADRADAARARALRQRTIGASSDDVTPAARSPVSAVRWCSPRSSPARSPSPTRSGRIRCRSRGGMAAVGTAISRTAEIGEARKRVRTVAQSFETMSRQLAELDKLKAEFVSVASHELKTPLNVVIGYLQLFDEGVYGPLTPKQREICRTLESQAQALSRLVKQLLDVSRFDAGGGRIDARPMHLGRFLDDLERAFDVLARQRGIAFRVVRSGELPTEVVWDADRVNEVMGNLISNAFKFTERDGTVELRARDRRSRSDRGAGTPERDHAAGATFRVREVLPRRAIRRRPRRRGTGLGLAIAKRSWRRRRHDHGREHPRRRNTFSLTLPVAPPAGARRCCPSARWRERLVRRAVVAALTAWRPHRRRACRSVGWIDRAHRVSPPEHQARGGGADRGAE